MNEFTSFIEEIERLRTQSYAQATIPANKHNWLFSDTDFWLDRLEERIREKNVKTVSQAIPEVLKISAKSFTAPFAGIAASLGEAALGLSSAVFSAVMPESIDRNVKFIVRNTLKNTLPASVTDSLGLTNTNYGEGFGTSVIDAYMMLEAALGSDYAEYYKKHQSLLDFTSLLVGGIGLGIGILKTPLANAGVGTTSLLLSRSLEKLGESSVTHLPYIGAKLSQTGIVADKLHEFGTNWQRMVLAKNALQEATLSGAWKITKGLQPKIIGANMVDGVIQAALADVIITSALLYHPWFEDKTAAELYAQVPYTAIGGGVLFGGLLGWARIGELKREISKYKPAEYVNLDTNNFGIISENIPGNAIASARNFMSTYDMFIQPGVDPKDVETIKGLVEKTVSNRIIEAFKALNVQKLDVTPLYSMVLDPNVSTQSISGLFHGVAKITRPKLVEEIPLGRIIETDLIGGKTIVTKDEIYAIVYDSKTGAVYTGTPDLRIGDVVAGVNKDGEFVNVGVFKTPKQKYDTIYIGEIKTIAARTQDDIASLSSVDASLNAVYNARKAIEDLKNTKEDFIKLSSSSPIVYLETAIREADNYKKALNIDNKLYTQKDALELLASIKGKEILKLLEEGNSIESIAIKVGMKEEDVLKVLGKNPNAEEFISYETVEELLEDHLKQRFYRFEYARYDPKAKKFIEGIATNSLVQGLIADYQAAQNAFLKAAEINVERAFGKEFTSALIEAKKRFNIAEIDFTHLPNATFLRQQTSRFLSPEGVAFTVDTEIKKKIIEIKKELSESQFARSIANNIINPASKANIAFQEILRKVLDYNFSAGKQALMYVRDSSENVIGIKNAEFILAEKTIEKLQNEINDAIIKGNIKKYNKKQKELSEAQQRLAELKSSTANFEIDFKDIPEVVDLMTSFANLTNNVMTRQYFLNLASGDVGPAQVFLDDTVMVFRPEGKFQAFIKRPDNSWNGNGEMLLITANTREELENKINKIKDLLKKDKEGKTFTEVIHSYDPKVAVEFKRLQGVYDYTRDFAQRAYNPLIEAHKNEGRLLYDIVPAPNFELLNAQLQALEKISINQVKRASELIFHDELAQLRAMHDAVQQGRSPLLAYDPENIIQQTISDRKIRTAWGDVADMLVGEPGRSTNFTNLWTTINVGFQTIGNKIIGNLHKFFKDKPNEEIFIKEYTENFKQVYKSLGYDTNLIDNIFEEVVKHFKGSPYGDYFIKNDYINKTVDKTRSFLSHLALIFDHAAHALNYISAPINYIPVFRELVRELKASTSLDPKVSKEFIEYVNTTYAMKEFSHGLVRILRNDTVPTEIAERFGIKTAIKYRDLLHSFKAFEAPKEIVENFRAFEIGLQETQSGILTAEHIIKFTKEAAESYDGILKNALAKSKNAAEAVTNIFRWSHAASEYFIKAQLADLAVQVGLRANLDAETIKLLVAQATSLGGGVRFLSQKPELFRGALGKVVTMFQNYTFNLGHQFLRAIEQGDKAAAAFMVATQAGLHGLSGIPFFDLYNKLAIGESQRNYGDIYTSLRDSLGTDVSNLILYGLSSNVLSLGLYNRGDITPRSVFIVPSNPADWVPIQLLGKFFTATHYAAQLAGTLPGGEGFTDALARLIEHNGINRPLGNLMARIQGYSTTGKFGTVRYYYNTDPILKTTSAGIPAKIGDILVQLGVDGEFLDWFSYIAAATGARPLNEEILRDTIHRYQYYQAATANKKKVLGQAIAMIMADGDLKVDPDKATEIYLKAQREYFLLGGTDKGFKQMWARAKVNADKGSLEQLKDKLSAAQTRSLLVAIGADPVQYRLDKDYWNGIKMDKRFERYLRELEEE